MRICNSLAVELDHRVPMSESDPRDPQPTLATANDHPSTDKPDETQPPNNTEQSGDPVATGGERAGNGNDAQSEEIAAYFKLESALFTYYCQTLVVTIGRRPPVPLRNGEAAPSESAGGSASGGGGGTVGEGEGTLLPPHEILTLSGPSNNGSTENDGAVPGAPPVVDVDLGQLKAVSRLHARIEYDENEACFVLAVLGRNGAWVDGEWYGSGRRAPLIARYVYLVFILFVVFCSTFFAC
ncbi:hypothetical protein BDV93DRAFT_146360 [Ceratobasidium sp. AG-I]|nr:hypothetical protein BDV93DRAFT_146360 [Ceratobasidium sp. AG-I]